MNQQSSPTLERCNQHRVEGSGPSVLSVVVADAQPILREGVRRLLEADSKIEVVGQAGTGLEAVQLAASLVPDIVFLGLQMPDFDGIEACLRIRRVSPTVKVLVLSEKDSYYYLERALQAGAAGFVLKQGDVQELLHAVRIVMQGSIYLTPVLTTLLVQRHLEEKGERENHAKLLSAREVEVLTMIARGLTNVAIAENLTLSIKTVQSHRTNILAKLGLHDQVSLVKYALRSGLVDGDDDHLQSPHPP